jgi:hypothetical protein
MVKRPRFKTEAKVIARQLAAVARRVARFALVQRTKTGEYYQRIQKYTKMIEKYSQMGENLPNTSKLYLN